jgi:hypothetical protein
VGCSKLQRFQAAFNTVLKRGSVTLKIPVAGMMTRRLSFMRQTKNLEAARIGIDGYHKRPKGEQP